MNRLKIYRRCLTGLLAAALAVLAVLGYSETEKAIPDSYTQTEGESAPRRFGFPVTETVSKMAEASANPYASGSYTISYKYLGLIPLKDVKVELLEPAYVIPGGIPLGIYMETKGILVVGSGKVTGKDGLEYEPSHGIVKSGDYIQKINGQTVSEKEDLIHRINEEGEGKVILDLTRNGTAIRVSVDAVQTGTEEYKLGLWVRDNTQGIGTLTFLTGDGRFGALGHGINDADTGTLLQLSEGALYDTNIIEIKKGEKGSPGELSGLIRYRADLICGEILENTAAGIFGTIEDHIWEKLDKKELQVGYRQEIEIGEAQIRCTVDGEIRDYRVEITEIHRNDADVNKGIVLKVTDERLLALTGGIVQGMSGSPILQNGKIVGAVTHVFVQDSTKGFGIFIENMLDALP